MSLSLDFDGISIPNWARGYETVESLLRRRGDTWLRRSEVKGECLDSCEEDGDWVSIPEIGQAERTIADEILRRDLPRHNVNIKALVGGLSEDQSDALSSLLRRKVGVLTGGPGTGKSHCLAALVRALPGCMVVAPTGIAARRCRESSGSGSTIHKAIGYNGNKYTVSQLACRALIIDEASMVDVPLLAALLRRLPDNAPVYLIGDTDQLPSVRPGATLRDLSASIPTFRLTKQHRYDDYTDVGDFAECALRGESLAITDDDPVSWFKAYKGKKRRVLCSRNIDVDSVNERAHRDNKTGYYPVMCINNDYKNDIFNGDTGIAHAESVQWESGVETSIYANDGEPHRLAYSSTVWKSQGISLDAVSLYIPQGGPMDRQLLYTAITRSKGVVSICGDQDTLDRSLAREPRRRVTRLREFLKR